MAGVICLKTYQLLATARRKANLPAENGTDQHPAQVALVVQRIQIRGHDIASIGINTVVRPLHNGRRSWYCGHVCRGQQVEVGRLMEGMELSFFCELQSGAQDYVFYARSCRRVREPGAYLIHVP
jgi:hypothetical protein